MSLLASCCNGDINKDPKLLINATSSSTLGPSNQASARHGPKIAAGTSPPPNVGPVEVLTHVVVCRNSPHPKGVHSPLLSPLDTTMIDIDVVRLDRLSCLLHELLSHGLYPARKWPPLKANGGLSGKGSKPSLEGEPLSLPRPKEGQRWGRPQGQELRTHSPRERGGLLLTGRKSPVKANLSIPKADSLESNLRALHG